MSDKEDNLRFVPEITVDDVRFVIHTDHKLTVSAYTKDTGEERLYGVYDDGPNGPVQVLLRAVIGQAKIAYKTDKPYPGPIIQDWCHTLGLRHQGTLLGAIRGCDGTPKEDPSKWIVRFLRACVLRAHVGDPRKAVSFMEWTDSEAVFKSYAKGFLNDFDRYPTHYSFHVLQAAHILGCYHPGVQRNWWMSFYLDFCRKLHVNPETKDQMDARLNKGEKEFGEDQKL